MTGFLKEISQECSVPNGLTEALFDGVDVDYDNPLLPVSAQIESEVLSDINISTQSVVPFLRLGLGMDVEAISPFAKQFSSLMELAHVYFYYLSADTRAQLDHVFPPPVSNFMANDEVDEYDDIAIEDADEALRYAVNSALDDDINNDDVGVQSHQFIPDGLQPSSTLHHSENNDGEAICSWKTLNEVMHEVTERNMQSYDSSSSFTSILSMLSACMKKTNQRLNGSTSDVQKYKSLKGRWWGESKTIEGSELDEATSLKRGMMFQYNGRTYKILNVFKKSYNKWRLETHGEANKTTKLQAVAIAEDRMIPNTYEIDGNGDRKGRCILVSGDKVVPFASIVSQGWINTAHLA